MEIVKGQIGPEAEYGVKFEGGKMLLVASYEGEYGGLGFNAHIPADKIVAALVDAAEKAIPGDQTLFAEMLKASITGAMK